MGENKMQLLNKLFNNETIRTIRNKEEEKSYIHLLWKENIIYSKN